MIKKAFPFGSIGIGLALLLSLVGELSRFHGFLWIDLFVPLFVLTWTTIQAIQKRPIRLPKTALPVLIFLFFGFASLLLHSGDMSGQEVLESTFYGVRFAAFFLLSVVVWNQSAAEKKHSLLALLFFIFLLCVAGFIQLKIMPDFTTMELLGWDPHQNRLLSTWFDPNFVGGFLAFMLPIVVGVAWDAKKHRAVLAALALVMLLALVLTLSRSAYLALMAGLFVFGLLRSIKLLFVFMAILLVTLSFLPPVQSRFLSLVESIESAFVEDYFLPDASARLRYDSWGEAWQLFLKEPWIGHGYNRYKHAALELGTLKDLEIHSASGSDSSLLNILATTGLLGFIPFLAAYLLLAKQAWVHKKSGFAAGFLAGLCGLFIHAIFVNSLLFPLFMAPFWITAGLLPHSKEAE
ncbi:MAG: O-antigen ligase family protein [Candidatus Gracilibacteria bacterium]|jgi:O-antigen ligase